MNTEKEQNHSPAPVSRRDPAKEKAMQSMAQYVKAAKSDADSGEKLRMYSDPKRGLNVCFREKVYECTNSDEACSELCPGRAIVDENWGVAICNPGDKYNQTVGEYIAIKRARRAKIPKSITPYI